MSGHVYESLLWLELTGSSVSVSVSPAQSSPGVVQMGLSRTRGAPFTDAIPKRRFRRLMLLLDVGLDPDPRCGVNTIVFSPLSSSSVSVFM